MKGRKAPPGIPWSYEKMIRVKDLLRRKERDKRAGKVPRGRNISGIERRSAIGQNEKPLAQDKGGSRIEKIFDEP
jgi:hypothetical protein